MVGEGSGGRPGSDEPRPGEQPPGSSGSPESEERAATIAATLRTWAGISTERDREGSLAFALGPRRIGRVDDAGTVDAALPEPVWTRLVESDRVDLDRVSPGSRRVGYYLPDHPQAADAGPATVGEALWLLRVAYLSHALTLSNTGPGGDVLASIDVESELRDLDLDEPTRAVFEELRGR